MDLDHDLWIEFLAWHQICIVTMGLSVVTGLYQTLFAITGPNSDVLTDTCSCLGLEPVTLLWIWWLGLLVEPVTTPWHILLSLLRGWWGSCSAGPTITPGSLSVCKQLMLLCPGRGDSESIWVSMPAFPWACWTQTYKFPLQVCLQ